MNNPLNQLETELRQLSPAPLPAQTQRRLQDIGQTPAWFVVRWPVWAAALATVTVVLALRIQPQPVPPAATATDAAVTGCQPSILRVLYGECDEGVVLINATTPYRKLRREYVNLYTWDRCRPGVRFEHSTRSEEVVYLPVAVY